MAKKTRDNKDLVHHLDRPSYGFQANRGRATGSQHLSIKYTKRLAEADIDLMLEPSVMPMIMRWLNSASIRGLTRRHWGHGPPQIFKTEMINQIGPWKSLREVEWETLKWPYGDASIAYRLIGRLV